MTRNGNFKRRVRARAAKTGESYTAALRHLRQSEPTPRPRRAPSLFRISSRRWLRRELVVSGPAGDTVLTGSWTPGLPPTWTVRRDGEIVATLRCRIFATRRTCIVHAGGETFAFRNRWSFSRRVEVQGGPFDGATLSGNLSDLKFRLEHRGRLLAEAEGRLVSLHDAHIVRMSQTDDPAVSQLAALMMIDLMIQKHADS